MRLSRIHKYSPFGSIHPHCIHTCVCYISTAVMAPYTHTRVHTCILTCVPCVPIAIQLAQFTLSPLTSSESHIPTYILTCTRTHSTQCQMINIHVHVLHIVSDGSLVHFTHFSYISYSLIHPHVLTAALTGSHTHVFSLSILFQLYFGTFPSRHIRVSPSC